MSDVTSEMTVADEVGTELAELGYKKRFREEGAFKAYDQYISSEMRLTARLRQLSLFRSPDFVTKENTARPLPGDIVEIQVLFELKRLYSEALLVEDAGERMRIQSKIIEQITDLTTKLSARQQQAMEFIEQVLNRKAKGSAPMEPADIYALAKEA